MLNTTNIRWQMLVCFSSKKPKSVVMVPDPNNKMDQGKIPAASIETPDSSDLKYRRMMKKFQNTIDKSCCQLD
jgi:hypothetical protein